LAEIPIISPKPLKLDKNPYLLKNEEYYNKRKENTIYAKFRACIYMKYKHICTVCGESLHNGEKVELHHIVARKKGGKYNIDNIQPLHQICHQKVTHSRLNFKIDKEE
jgi:5-methylcytosine-specific restriction endonuclease McrA